jgi:rod shape-determining protein MreC
MKNWGAKKIIFSALGLVLLIFLNFLGILRPIENVVISTLKPLNTSIYRSAQTLRRNFLNFAQDYNLSQENYTLKEQIFRLESTVSQLDKLKNENNFLRKELAFVEENDYRRLGVKILGKEKILDNQFFTINQGRQAGIVVGSPLIAYQGHLIGVVKSLEDQISFVQPLTNPDTSLAAVINTTEKIPGVVKGDLDLSLKLELVPAEAKVLTGDLVETSGLDPLIPAGLIIGKVISVKEPEAQIFPRIELVQEINLDFITNAVILLP